MTIRIVDRAFVYSLGPGPNAYIAQHLASGVSAIGDSPQAAVAAFKALWCDRSEIAFVLRRPPAPLAPGERPSEAKQLAEAQAEIRHDRVNEVFDRWAKIFHPDVAGNEARFTGGECLRALIELRDASVERG